MSICILSKEHIVDTLLERAGSSVFPDVYAEWLWNLSDESLIIEYKVAMGLGHNDNVYLNFEEYQTAESPRRRRQAGFMRHYFEEGLEYERDISKEAAAAAEARNPPRARCPRTRPYLVATVTGDTDGADAVTC